ncbi:MAG: esterase-like activity of phytase family protein [Aphanocapsa lilacina HA4352-LM1]|jgi:hypothetical protein|nr:esterase-like activity of phytase family protein [Aphanocapsa lilacina HA4352-LM1]
MKNTTIGMLLAVCVAGAPAGAAGATELVGRAVLPAETYAFGPTSGQFTTGGNGIVAPYLFRQPVQGVSSVIAGPVPGTYRVLSDNGFGAKSNSADYLLRSYGLRPDFKTATGGSGRVFPVELATGALLPAFDFATWLQLQDPAAKAGFAIVAEQATYYPTSTIPVDPGIKNNRLLTGADFDLESFRKVPDGTFWVGEEFGPFLLHFSATGELLDAPVALPNFAGFGTNPLVQSPDNPLLNGATPNLGGSRGFEGLALNASGDKLYALLEGPLIEDPDRNRLIINEFDLATKTYTGKIFFYRMENTTESGQAIGELTAINDSEFLVIERDGKQGDPNNPAFADPAQFKRIYKIDLRKLDSQGFVEKELVVDLLNIPDPNNVGGNGTTNGTFTFPFVTIESVLPIAPRLLLVANDNNFPGSVGRTPEVADDNEFILVRLDKALRLTAR